MGGLVLKVVEAHQSQTLCIEAHLTSGANGASAIQDGTYGWVLIPLVLGRELKPERPT